MNSVSNEELYLRLERLAIAAKLLPRGSQERQLALKNLIDEIYRQSHRLVRPSSSKYPSRLCPEIFDIARQRLLFYVYHPDNNIDTYDPLRGKVMTWLNVNLDRRFFEETIKQLIDKNIIVLTSDKLQDDLINNVIYETNNILPSELVKQCIEEDPDGVFASTHIRHKREANFKIIAFKRFNGESWQEIAEAFDGVSVSTVSTFYYNCSRDFADRIKKYVQD